MASPKNEQEVTLRVGRHDRVRFNPLSCEVFVVYYEFGDGYLA
jgi:hypothetical protein